MTIAITAINLGTVPGDSTGSKARPGGAIINTNFTNLKTGVEFLEGRFWIVQNGAVTAVLGRRYICNSHAGFALTMPAAFAMSTTAYNDVWVSNTDDASDVTLTPASGDAFFVNGATLGVDTTYTLVPGSLAILSPRTSNSQWDLLVLSSGVSNHELLSNIGTNTHAQIDTHLGLTDEHLDWTADQGGTNIHADNLAVASVALAKLANMATASFLARNTGGTGVPEVISAAIARSILNVADGANAYSHPNHTGEVTSSGDGALTIAADAVTWAKLQNVAANNRILGNVGGAGAIVVELTKAQVLTMLNVEDGAAVDQADSEIETAYNNQVGAMSQATAEAGVSTTIERITAQRLSQAIAALAAAGDAWGDVVDANIIPDVDVTRNLGSASLNFADLFVDYIEVTQGISFGADTVAEYEVGTWTPFLMDTSGGEEQSQTYSVQIGHYIIIGNELFYHASMNLSGLGTLTGSQPARIGGLPRNSIDTVNSQGSATIGIFSGFALDNAGTTPSGYVQYNQDYIKLYQQYGITNNVDLTVDNFSASGQIKISGHYRLP